MKRGQALLPLISLLLGACRAEDPFRIPSETFFRETAELAVVGNLLYEVHPQLEERVSSRLQLAGFRARTVHGPQRYSRWLEGLLDSHPGSDGRSVEELYRQEFGDLEELHSVDAILVLSAVLRPAEFSNEWARWDGHAEQVAKPTLRHLLVWDKYWGQVGALSVLALVFDPSGTLQYERYRGIGLLARIEEDGVVDIPPEQVLQDGERVARAVDGALEPLWTR